jgi:hypothetical protein
MLTPASNVLLTGVAGLIGGELMCAPSRAVGRLGTFFPLAYVLKCLPVLPVCSVGDGLSTAGAAVVGLFAFGERIAPGIGSASDSSSRGSRLRIYAPHAS